MSAKEYKNVRFVNRIDSITNWKDANSILKPGELGFFKYNNNYIMVVGDGKTTSVDIVNSLMNNNNYYDNIIFYPGKVDSSDLEIPMASASLLGGVKIKENTTSGLNIDDYGYLTNALIDGYDYVNKRFIINKLYVKDLEYKNKAESTSFTGNTITLRDGAEIEATDFIGFKIDNFKNNAIGYFGLNPNGTLKISQPSGQTVDCYGVFGQGDGYLNISDKSGVALLKKFQPLKIVTGLKKSETGEIAEDYINYIPTTNAEINITPYDIIVNGQTIKGDNTTRTYTIELDGGLTPENAEKLNNLDALTKNVAELNVKSIFTLVGDDNKKITTKSEGNNSFSIKHNTIETTKTSTKVEYVVKTGSEGVGQKRTLTYVKDITVDSTGHIVGINYEEVAWYIATGV